MIKRRDKRGQFYLLAAIVIIAIIIGFAAVSNQMNKPNTSTKVYNLKDELNVESENVLDYGVLSSTEDKTTDFATKFTEYSGVGNRNIFFIIGNKDNLKVYSYEDVVVGSVVIGNTGDIITEGNVIGTSIPEDKITADNKVEVIINENTYDFTLKEGENFYFIIYQQVGSETQVVTGEAIKNN
jgi:hypothetical protein